MFWTKNDREVALWLDLNKITADILPSFLVAIHVAEWIGEENKSYNNNHDEKLDQNDEPKRSPQCHATESIHIKAVYII